MLARAFLAVLAVGTAAHASAVLRVPGSCTNPAVRKEWRELSDTEKAEYIRAAVCLRNLPKTKYTELEAVTTRLDELVYTHFALNTDIHFVANFLPWHRWYLKLHEDLLRTECGFTGTQPYWDWSIDADANDTQNSPVFDPVTGFGGNNKPTGSTEPGFERCVVDGPFANTNLTLGMGWPDRVTVWGEVPGHRQHCFTRAFNGGLGNDENGELIIGDMQATAYSSTVMRTIYGFDNFVTMADMLEGLPHAQSLSSQTQIAECRADSFIVHSIIFGDMGPATSPNEPLFFLHHANVDRVWAKVRLLFSLYSSISTIANRTTVAGS